MRKFMINVNGKMCIRDRPIPPLDGFHVVTSLFVRKSYKVVDFLWQYGYWILLILLFTGVLDYILTPAIDWFTSLYYSFFSLFV